MKLDAQLARCLVHLTAPEFAPLREWLETVHRETGERLETMGDPDQLRRLQGKATFLREFREMVDSSHTLLGKLAGRPQTR